MAVHLRYKYFDGAFRHSHKWLRNGGHGRAAQTSHDDIVESGHDDILRDANSVLAKDVDGRKGHRVVGRDHRVEGNPASEDVLHGGTRRASQKTSIDDQGAVEWDGVTVKHFPIGQ